MEAQSNNFRRKERNKLIDKRFKDLYDKGFRREFIIERLSEEFFIHPGTVGRIIRDQNKYKMHEV
jgi:hypothetical protein